jgi:hypothetical protein
MGASAEPVPNPPNQRVFRRHERIYEPLPVMVSSVDPSSEAFEVHTVLDNFSASGLYVWLERRVEPGTKLFAIVRLSTSSPETPAPCVAVQGLVLRAEPRPNGTWGAAMRFIRYRFL